MNLPQMSSFLSTWFGKMLPRVRAGSSWIRSIVFRPATVALLVIISVTLGITLNLDKSEESIKKEEKIAAQELCVFITLSGQDAVM